jgi:hypothetical protein
MRLNPTGGEMSVAPSSRTHGGPSTLSSHRFAMRYSASPRKLPPMPVEIWSLRDGGVVSPAISHSALAANV